MGEPFSGIKFYRNVLKIRVGLIGMYAFWRVDVLSDRLCGFCSVAEDIGPPKSVHSPITAGTSAYLHENKFLN